MELRYTNRIYWIDNLRSFLTLYVVVVHTLLGYTYQSPYFVPEKEIIGSTNFQYFHIFSKGFLMHLFFFVSGYVLYNELQRKTLSRILKSKIIRYGIPIVIYQVIKYAFFNRTAPSTWYLEVLMLFSVIAYMFRNIWNKIDSAVQMTISLLLSIGLAVWVLTFLIRLRFPLHCMISLPFFHIEPADSIKYFTLFFLGIISSKNHFVESLSSVTTALIMIFAGFLVVIGLVFRSNILEHLNHPLYTLFEVYECLLICWALIIIFYKYLNKGNVITSLIARQSMGVYLTHSVLLLLVQHILFNISFNIYLKICLVFFITTLLSYITSYILRKVPYIKEVL